MATDNRFKPIAVDMGGSLTSTPGGSAAGAVSGNTMLLYGSSGNDVRNLQNTLKAIGYDVGTVDGIFGNQTKNAVIQYQKDTGLSADGIVGDQTWGALKNSGIPSTMGVNPTPAAYNDGTYEKPASAPVVPNTMGVKPTPVAYNENGSDLRGITDSGFSAPTSKTETPNFYDILESVDGGNTPSGWNAPTGGNNTGGNVPTGGNAPTGGNVQTPTSQDILAMYDEQSSTTETPAPNTPEPASPAPAPSAYTPPERNPYYEPNYRRLLNEMEAYPDFTFDQNSDPLWASLAKQYRREGQRATADTLGQAAGLTGGIASTAAVTAASQAGDYYGAQLSDRLQDVYNNAYQQYLDRYSRLLGLEQEYRWGTDFEEGQFTGDRSFDRGVYTDDRNFDYDQYLSDRDFKYKQETDAYNRQQSSVEEAKSRVASFISMGGDPSQLDPEIVQQSGLSPAEINQMRNYYAQQAAAAAAKASGGGGSSGGGRGGSGVTSGSNETGNGNIYDALYAGGATDYGTAYAMLLSQGYGVTAAKQLATYYNDTYYPGMTASGNNPLNNSGNSEAAQLMALFPGGIVKSAKYWSDLVKAYGEDWLTKNGFRHIAVPSKDEQENIPVSSYGSGNYSGLGDRMNPDISASYFEDGSDDFNSIEAEYQAALKDTRKAAAFIGKYGNTPVSESEFSRSSGMVKEYGTYQNYINAMMYKLMS